MPENPPEDPKAISRRDVFQGLLRRSAKVVRTVIEESAVPARIPTGLPGILEKAHRVYVQQRPRLRWGAPAVGLGASHDEIDAAIRDTLATDPSDETARVLRELYTALPWFRTVPEVAVLRAGRSLHALLTSDDPEADVPDLAKAERARTMHQRILTEVAQRTAEIDALVERLRRASLAGC